MQDGSSSSSTEKQAEQQRQQQQERDQHHQASAMDDFLDNIISIPSWSEASALKAHWDCNPAAAAAAASSGDFGVESAPSKLLKSSFTVTQQQQQQQFSSISQELLQDTAILHNVAALSNVLGSRGSLPPPIDLARSLSEGSEPQELTASAAAWCQQYQQLDLHQPNQSGRLVSSERAPVFGNTAQTRVSGQQQTTNSPPTTSAGALKPRVRARRGQATDPHSIAERLRRERIADRMKALQELVPNANKTDKASMLDEIIEYVKFLQLQVKVLSMSRLGAASFVSPLIADLPPTSSEGIQATTVTSTQEAGGFCLSESQVARLMEEDMGSAMQYLQSKGLCLMPITLASAISSPSSRASSSMTTTPTAAAGSSPQHQQQSEISK